MIWWQAFFRLLFFLWFLPFLLTYLHLRVGILQRSNLVFVGPNSASHQIDNNNQQQEQQQQRQQSYYGIYRPDTATTHHHTTTTHYRQVFATTTDGIVSKPTLFSVASISNLLARATTTTTTMIGSSVVDQHLLSYDSSTSQWCLISLKTTTKEEEVERRRVACSGGSSSTIPSSESSILPPPPSGVWTSSTTTTLSDSSSSSSVAVRVSYMGGPQEASTTTRKRKRNNKNVEQTIVRRPATTLLLSLNVLLAFLYWNRRVSIADVAKNYDRMVHFGEHHRAFSGALAHFELFHLGFNMMALQSLGTELEGVLFGSIAFLFYNISLVVLTTMLLVLGWYYSNLQQQQGSSNATTSSSNTVGYSGVLFAWMVISSLERDSTCPVFFVPDLCFQTYTLWWKLKFNISPLIQLGVAQLIMPRASFLGHLAGICAGFLLHWNLLPIEYFQPSVLIPTTMLMLLWRARKIVPVPSSSSEEEDDDDNNNNDEEQQQRVSRTMNNDDSAGSGRFDARRHKRNRDRSLHRLFVYSHYGMILSMGLSFVTMTTFSSLVITPVLCWYLFYSCLSSHALFLKTSSSNNNNTERHNHEKQRLGVLLRYFVVACVLFMVCDSMTLASWIVMRDLWGSRWILPCAVMVLRLIVYTAGLSVACKRLSDIGETGSGIFPNVLQYTVLENARTLGNYLFSFMNKSNQWTAFEGRGITLGGTSRLVGEEQPQQETRQISGTL